MSREECLHNKASERSRLCNLYCIAILSRFVHTGCYVAFSKATSTITLASHLGKLVQYPWFCSQLVQVLLIWSCSFHKCDNLLYMHRPTYFVLRCSTKRLFSCTSAPPICIRNSSSSTGITFLQTAVQQISSSMTANVLTLNSWILSYRAQIPTCQNTHSWLTVAPPIPLETSDLSLTNT